MHIRALPDSSNLNSPFHKSTTPTINNKQQKLQIHADSSKNKIIKIKRKKQSELNADESQKLEKQVDLRLTQAYQQIEEQPSRSPVLGNTKTYIFPNDLLDEYIKSVYLKYDIQEPQLKIKKIKENKKQQLQQYQTVKKKVQPSHGQPQTLKKVYRLKQNICTELSQPATFYHTPKHIIKTQPNFRYNPQNYKFPIAAVVKNLKLQQKPINDQFLNKEIKNERKQLRYFCLLCQVQLTVNDGYNKYYACLLDHKQCCPENIEKFLNLFYPNLPQISIISEIMNMKLSKTKKWLRNANQQLIEETKKINNTLDNPQINTPISQQTYQDLMKLCYMRIQYLNWIRQIKRLISCGKQNLVYLKLGLLNQHH